MNNLHISPPKFLQKPSPYFFMAHLLHRLYGVDAPAVAYRSRARVAGRRRKTAAQSLTWASRPYIGANGVSQRRNTTIRGPRHHRRRLNRGNWELRPGTHARTGANVAFCPGTFHGCALIF